MVPIIVKNRNKRAFMTEKLADGNYFIRHSQDISEVVNRYGKLENERYRIFKKMARRIEQEFKAKDTLGSEQSGPDETAIHRLIEDELHAAGVL